MSAAKDWTGIRHNNFTFIRPTDKKYRGKILWEVQCDCGELLIAEPARLKNVQSCRKCAGIKSRKDWTGQKYHRLTFIRPTDQKRDTGIIWECLCDCGTITYIQPCSATNGKTKSCGCLALEHASALGKASGDVNRVFEPHISSARRVWKSTYSEIDFDTFYAMSQCTCVYCGRLPFRVMNEACWRKHASDKAKQEGDFIYNGLDRIDSNKSHTIDNLVTSCWDCNHMKGTRTHAEFLAHIKRIYEYNYAASSSVSAEDSLTP